jgi:hypothetical protein
LARFRLRFLLQEFDIVGPEVVIGRSPECHLTIEDPLVSRQHARIHVLGEEATIEDLGSRNGVRINGRKIEGAHVLKDGDRIRLGTQELVFSAVQRQGRAARPTGYMRVCAACGTPYPEVAPQCPHCGHTEPRDEDTISGLMVEPRRSWTFQLLGEVIERAIATRRSAEADRLMRRAAKEVDDRMTGGEHLDPNQVALITGFAVRLASLQKDSEWLAWALRVHRRQQVMPSSEVIDRIEEIDLEAQPDVRPVLEAFVGSYRQDYPDGPPSADLAKLSRLEKLTR